MIGWRVILTVNLPPLLHLFLFIIIFPPAFKPRLHTQVHPSHFPLLSLIGALTEAWIVCCRRRWQQIHNRIRSLSQNTHTEVIKTAGSTEVFFSFSNKKWKLKQWVHQFCSALRAVQQRWEACCGQLCGGLLVFESETANLKGRVMSVGFCC